MKQENFIITVLYIQRMSLIYVEFECIPPIFYFNHHMFTFVFLIKKVMFIFFQKACSAVCSRDIE